LPAESLALLFVFVATQQVPQLQRGQTLWECHFGRFLGFGASFGVKSLPGRFPRLSFLLFVVARGLGLSPFPRAEVAVCGVRLPRLSKGRAGESQAEKDSENDKGAHDGCAMCTTLLVVRQLGKVIVEEKIDDGNADWLRRP